MSTGLSCSRTVIRNVGVTGQRDENCTSSSALDRSESCGFLMKNRINSSSRQLGENSLSSSARDRSKSRRSLPKNGETLRTPDTEGKHSIRYRHSILDQRTHNLEQENLQNQAKTEPKPEESKVQTKLRIVPLQIDNSSSSGKREADDLEQEEPEEPLYNEKNSKEMNSRKKSVIILSPINKTMSDRNINLKKNIVSKNKLPQNHSDVPEIKFDGTSEYVELPYSKTRVAMIFKRMVQVKHLPVDPMLKYHKQRSQLALGFKTTERTDSIRTNSDEELDNQHRLWCQLEAMTGEYGLKFPKLILENTLFPIVTREDTKKKEEEEAYKWQGDGGIVHDPTERLWNWEGSMINSNLLRDKDGKPLFSPDLDIKHMSQPSDFDQVSLGPDEYDEQLRKLFIDSSLLVSDASKGSIDSELEYNEEQFLHSNFCHPLNDNRFNQYRLKRLLNKEGTLCNANRISKTDSPILDLMYQEAQDKKPKKKLVIAEEEESTERKDGSNIDSKEISGTTSTRTIADDAMNSVNGTNLNNVNNADQPESKKANPSKRSRFFRRSSSTIEKEEEKWRYYWRKSLRGGSSSEESRRIYREILKELEDDFEEVEEKEEFHSPDQPIEGSTSSDALTEAQRVRKKTKEIRTRFVKNWMKEVDHIVYHVQEDMHDDSFRRMVDRSIQTKRPTPYWVRVGKRELSSKKPPTNPDESVEPPSQPEETKNEHIKSPSSEPSGEEKDENSRNESEVVPLSLSQHSEQENDRYSHDEETEIIPNESSESGKEEDWSLIVCTEDGNTAKCKLSKRSVKGPNYLPNQEESEIWQDRSMEIAFDLLKFSEDVEIGETLSVDSQLSDEDEYENSVYDLDQTILTKKSLPFKSEKVNISYDATGRASTPVNLSLKEDATLQEKINTEATDYVPSKSSKEDENSHDQPEMLSQDSSTLSFMEKSAISEKLSSQSLVTSTKSLTPLESTLKNPDGKSPDKPKASFHFAEEVVIGPVKPRPMRRNRYRKPMRQLQIKIAEGEEHKRVKSKAEKGVQTLKFIPVWKISKSKLMKKSKYAPPVRKFMKIIKPSELTPEMINEEDRLIKNICGIPPPPPPPSISKGEQIKDIEKNWKKNTSELGKMHSYELYDVEYKKKLDRIIKRTQDDTLLPAGTEAVTIDHKQAEQMIDENEGQSNKGFTDDDDDRLNKNGPISTTLHENRQPSPTATSCLTHSSSESSPLLRQPKMYKEMVDFFENMTRWERIAFELSYKGWEHAGYEWKKIKEAVSDPDGQHWADMYDNIREDAFFAQYQKPHTLKDFMPKAGERGKLGLGKRCAGLVNGTRNLYRGLFRADPKMTSIEMVLDAMFKDRLFGLPLSLKDVDEMRHYYTNIIVRDPKLYRAIMKNRDCLQHDLLVMVHNVLRGLNITDNALADRYPCSQQTRMIQLEANKKYASKLLLEEKQNEEKPVLESSMKFCQKRPHEVYFEKHFNEAGSDFRYPPAEQLIIDAAVAVDMDKETRIKVYNPASNIIEEARYLTKDFATYAYPLFEANWRVIGYDRQLEIMLPELKELRDFRQMRLDKQKIQKTFTLAENEEYTQKSKKLSKDLVDRVREMLNSFKERNRPNGVWKCLLACIHGITLWREIEDCLMDNFKEWVQPLLQGLRSDEKLVRQEVCYAMALLVSNYCFISRLHKESKNRLITNLTFALLDAIEEYPESYLFYHGVMAYLLHSAPCNAILLAILTWVPEIMDRGDESDLARDWPLFIYYVAKHWPQSAIRWRYNHEERILELLERALLRPISKRNAQLALKYVCRREECLPRLFTVWRGRKIGEHVRIIDRQVFDGSKTYDI